MPRTPRSQRAPPPSCKSDGRVVVARRWATRQSLGRCRGGTSVRARVSVRVYWSGKFGPEPVANKCLLCSVCYIVRKLPIMDIFFTRGE